MATKLRECLQEFQRDNRARALAAPTLANYEYRVGLLVEWLGEQGITTLEELERRHLRAFLAHGAERMAPSTLALTTRALKRFLNWCNHEDLLGDRNLASGITTNRIPQTVITTLNEKQIQQLAEAAGGESHPVARWLNLRDKAIIHIMGDAGLRLGEVITLRRDGVDTLWRRARVTGKGSRQREVLLGRDTRSALRAYRTAVDLPTEHAGVPWLFVSANFHQLADTDIWRLIKRAGEAIGIKDIHPHLLRHSFAVNFLRAQPGQIEQLRRLLGHSTLEMTRHYLQGLGVEDALLAHGEYLARRRG